MSDIIFIKCIGADRKIHVCEPHKDTAICGCQVINKNVPDYDFHNRYSCDRCSY